MQKSIAREQSDDVRAFSSLAFFFSRMIPCSYERYSNTRRPSDLVLSHIVSKDEGGDPNRSPQISIVHWRIVWEYWRFLGQI